MESATSEELDLTKYITAKKLSAMSDLEKKCCANRIRNYEMMKSIGFQAAMPECMKPDPVPGANKAVKKKKKRAKKSSASNDVDWSPELEEAKTGHHSKKCNVTFTSTQSSDSRPTAAVGQMKQKLTCTETMQQRRKNHGAAARRTDGAVGGRPLIPFRGFSREYILQHQKMAKEAIRRKEIIINLLKSGSLTEKQLNAIVPPHTESTEPAPTEAASSETHRYPKRSIARKNYHESSDEDTDPGNFCFYCDLCRRDYEGVKQCPKHSSAAVIEYYMDSRTVSHTLPDGLLLKESSICNAGLGVFTAPDFTIRKDRIFGPYAGVIVVNQIEAHESGYSWQIYKRGRITHWVDGRDPSRSNWLRYINCASTVETQNMTAFQSGGDIYYRAVQTIRPNTELMVWYGDDYAAELGLISVSFSKSLDLINISQVSWLVCLLCDLEFRTDQLVRKHTRTRVSVHLPRRTAVPAISYKQESDQAAGQVMSSGVDGDVKKGKCVCDVCYKQFDRPSLLDRHKRIHSGEKPFKCDVCDQTFTDAGNLKSHKRLHTGEKPYKCDVCGYACTHSSDLNKHKRAHTGENPYKCDVCGQAFTQSSVLNVHKRTHTGENPYKCDVCGQTFTQFSSVNKHRQRVHHC